MAKPTQVELIESLLEKYAPEIRDAFLASIRDVVDNVKLGNIISALERNDLESAINAMHIEAPAFQPLDTVIRQAFIEAGTVTAATVPPIEDYNGARVVFRFDARMPEAEKLIATQSSQAIVEIVEDQRTAVRAALTEGLVKGDNPRETALDIVGRVNPVTKRREGGIIGITSIQERYVANARAELASGDPAKMAAYFDRARRDKSLDGFVTRAIKEKKPVAPEDIKRLTGRYADRLLKLRGEVVGRTESMASISAGRQASWEQAAIKGGFSVSDVTKRWVATLDKRTRDHHLHMNGEVVAMDKPFSNGLMFPGDPDGPPGEIINCRCRAVYRRTFKVD